MSLGKFPICGPGLRLAWETVRRNELAGEVAAEDPVPWKFPSACGDGEWLNVVAVPLDDQDPVHLPNEVSGELYRAWVSKVIGPCNSLFTLTGLSSSSSSSSNDELSSLDAAFPRFREADDLAVGIRSG